MENIAKKQKKHVRLQKTNVFSIPSNIRELLRLRNVEGRGTADIARMMGCNIRTINSWLKKCKDAGIKS